MIKYTLHKIKEGFIITSDEKCSKVYPNFYFENNEIYKFSENCLEDLTEFSFPVIAQQEQIDFSNLSEEDCKKIGYFNLNKFKIRQWNGYEAIKNDISTENGFKDGLNIGFKKAQELLSDKQFTLEEVINVAKMATGIYRTEKEIKNYIQSLQTAQWNIELEMEKIFYSKNGEPTTIEPGWGCLFNYKPKLINGKFKINKLQ